MSQQKQVYRVFPIFNKKKMIGHPITGVEIFITMVCLCEQQQVFSRLTSVDWMTE